MKHLRKLLPTFILCLALAVSVASCSDKEDEPSVPAAKSVAGVYNADMTCTVMGNESTFEDVTMTVAAEDDATVSVTISSFGEAPMKVPEIKVTGVNVTGTDGKYSLAATEFSGTSDSGMAYSGTLQGSFENNRISLQFSLQIGAMPMPLICSFTAPKE